MSSDLAGGIAFLVVVLLIAYWAANRKPDTRTPEEKARDRERDRRLADQNERYDRGAGAYDNRDSWRG